MRDKIYMVTLITEKDINMVTTYPCPINSHNLVIRIRCPDNMMYRGWIGGYENDKRLVSLYNFDWKVVVNLTIEK